MRIDAVNHINSLSVSSEYIFLKEGDHIRAEVLEQFGDKIILQVNNELLEAVLTEPMADVRGEFLNFIVDTRDQDKIFLRLQRIDTETSENKHVDSSLFRLLNQLGVEKNEKTYEVIRQMMAYSIPVDKSNVQEILILSARLDSLFDMKTEDQVFVLEKPVDNFIALFSDQPETLFLKQDLLSKESELLAYVKRAIRQGIGSGEIYRKLAESENLSQAKEIIVKIIEDQEHIVVNNAKEETHHLAHRISVKQKDLSSVNISDLTLDRIIISHNKPSNNSQNLKEKFLEYFGNASNNKDISSSQLLTFFKKNNISLNFGNLKTMMSYLREPEEFFSDLKKVEQVFRDNPDLFLDSLSEENGESELNSPMVSFDKINSPELLAKMKELYSDEEVWIEKIRFLQEMNKDMNFMFFPIRGDLFLKGGFVHYLKDNPRKKVDYRKTLNIMINVQTHNIGNVMVFCKAYNKKIDIKLKIREEDVTLFEAEIDKLKKVIETLGLEVNTLDYIFDSKYSILDLQLDSASSNCFLDVRV